MTTRKGILELREGQRYEVVILPAPETARYRELLKRLLPDLTRWIDQSNPALLEEIRKAVGEEGA